MTAFFWVFLGGGLGSICRFGVSQIVNSSSFPWATFVANAVSCIILGLLLAIQFKSPMNPAWRLLLTTGFCGGFSTFSTFSAETFALMQNGQALYAFLNIAGSILMGLLCVFVGFKMGGAA